MSEIDPFAAAGTVVTAFLGGSSIFYMIGRNAAKAEGKLQLDRKTRELAELATKAALLNHQLDAANKRVADFEGGRVPPPPTEQANQLVQTLLKDEDDVWLSEPIQKPHGHDERVANLRAKIICVANLKGGVGKTTTTANLAAYFDKELGQRVLVIDADYQGSLSAILNRMARTSDPVSSTAQWLEAGGSIDELVRRADKINDELPNTRYLSAFYQLSNVETRLMVEWLLSGMIGDPKRTDLRYVLSQALHSSAVQSKFDVVLIDCPPRLSTATINAICAGTHLLIPSVPDNSSLEAVANFLKMYRRVTARLNHNIQLLGVAPTLTMESALTDDEVNNLDKLKQRVRLFGGAEEPYVFKTNIPRNVPIARVAGSGIALLRAPAKTKKIFRDFGAELMGRMGPMQPAQAALSVAAE